MMAVCFRRWLWSLLLVTAGAQAAVELQLIGPEGQQHIKLPDGVYLADALMLPQVQAKAHWPCASISTPTLDKHLLVRKQALLARLDMLARQLLNDHRAALAMDVRQLRQQLDQWLQHAAINVTLDPDRLRIRQEENALLEGAYRLYLPSCERGLLLLGAVQAPGRQPLMPGQWLADYLAHHAAQPWADSSWAWYLDSRGAARKIGIDYWNRKHTEAADGAVLFLGFDEDLLPDEFRGINQAVAKLLQQGMSIQP